MPRNPDKVHCQVPACRAWAIRGSDPPLCSAHAHRNGPPPPGNQNARTHGFYSRVIHDHELADLLQHAGASALESEIAIARVALRRLFDYLAHTQDLRPLDYARLASVAFHGVRTIARLLRDHHTLTGAAGQDEWSQAINQALDELSAEWGVEL
ncbi:MAG: hypothetical protein PVG54_16115 [Anaerolineae bacterium]|jgi:hypothetical protein